MIRVKFDSNRFAKEMNNIVNYSTGFIEGVQQGKSALLENIGAEVVEGIKEFIDVNARINPAALHHVYEWYQTGSPSARLFDINYISNQIGLSFNSTFRQSVSVKNGSKVPFYNKAQIMENGVPVVIRPVSAQVLSFNENGEQVFTRGPVVVSDPGGQAVQGGYERVFDMFFETYFKQSFLRTTGILEHLQNPEPFKRNLSKGKRGGRSVGYSVGYKWISKKVG
jgi:hypothetical protein